MRLVLPERECVGEGIPAIVNSKSARAPLVVGEGGMESVVCFVGVRSSVVVL